MSAFARIGKLTQLFSDPQKKAANISRDGRWQSWAGAGPGCRVNECAAPPSGAGDAARAVVIALR